MPLLSDNNITKKNTTTNSIFLIFASSLILSLLFMFYISISYSQIESDESLAQQQPPCLEGRVLNELTGECEPSVEQQQQIQTEEEPATPEEEPATPPEEEPATPPEEEPPAEEPPTTTGLEDLMGTPGTATDQKQPQTATTPPATTGLEELTEDQKQPSTPPHNNNNNNNINTNL